MGTKTISTTTRVLEQEIESLEESILVCQTEKQPLVDRVRKIDENIEIFRMEIKTIREDLDKLYPPTE